MQSSRRNNNLFAETLLVAGIFLGLVVGPAVAKSPPSPRPTKPVSLRLKLVSASAGSSAGVLTPDSIDLTETEVGIVQKGLGLDAATLVIQDGNNLVGRASAKPCPVPVCRAVLLDARKYSWKIPSSLPGSVSEPNVIYLWTMGRRQEFPWPTDASIGLVSVSDSIWSTGRTSGPEVADSCKVAVGYSTGVQFHPFWMAHLSLQVATPKSSLLR